MQVSEILDLIVLISITDTKYLMITGSRDENEKMEVLDGSTNVTAGEVGGDDVGEYHDYDRGR